MVVLPLSGPDGAHGRATRTAQGNIPDPGSGATWAVAWRTGRACSQGETGKQAETDRGMRT
jgi:hypothetical protein